MEERKSVLVKLGEDSDLKVDLNLGVISLLVAKESYFQPHICLNEKSGVEVIKRFLKIQKKQTQKFGLMNLPFLVLMIFGLISNFVYL